MSERPISHVPRAALAVLVVALGMQLAWQRVQAPPSARAVDLPPAPALRTLQLASMGEPIALAKTLMLYLQAFDSQAGVQRPFRQLDYRRVQAWLGSVLALDPAAQYPLFAASQLYAQVSDDEPRTRLMLSFVRQQFDADPNRRWPALAHAVVMAKHRLHDLPLAREYAQALRLRATGPGVPHWAQQMEIFILEDMSELQSAKILLGGLLQSGQITEPGELRFLQDRLQALSATSSDASKK